jgi:hypothetical protein
MVSACTTNSVEPFSQAWDVPFFNSITAVFNIYCDTVFRGIRHVVVVFKRNLNNRIRVAIVDCIFD